MRWQLAVAVSVVTTVLGGYWHRSDRHSCIEFPSSCRWPSRMKLEDFLYSERTRFVSRYQMPSPSALPVRYVEKKYDGDDLKREVGFYDLALTLA